MALHALRVVFPEAEVERGKRRDRSGDADCRGRAYLVWYAFGENGSRRLRACTELARPAADVDDQSLGVDRTACCDSAKGQLGLVVTGQQPRLEPVAPLDLAEEGLAVLGIANG